MEIINDRMIDGLSAEARTLPRKRTNLNFHEGEDDLIQRMLNAFEPGSYVQPHRHATPPKREVFIAISGRLLVVFFDDEGRITSNAVLDQDRGVYGIEIPEGTWHTVIALESNTVVYEIKDGPYDMSSDKEFACWAPSENASDADGYLTGIINQCMKNEEITC
ncbi:cupin fold metalloprotein, WbuC family [Marinilabiliaceae bacterium JC017]|nr:cupin fold metalloprotein, WbuC family [Marinilabiliaceae bacterium JC017]